MATQLTADDLLAPFLGQPEQRNQGPVTGADVLAASPMVAALGEMLRMDIQRSPGGHQPWVPEFTDSIVVRDRGDNPWTPSKEVPVYIQPTGSYAQGKTSKIGQTAALTAPTSVAPTGNGTLDAWRIMSQRIADGDAAAGQYIQQQIAPIDAQLDALNTKRKELELKVMQWGSSTLGKDDKIALDNVNAIIRSTAVERDYKIKQLEQDEYLMKWQIDKETNTKELKLLEANVQMEAQVKKQEEVTARTTDIKKDAEIIRHNASVGNETSQEAYRLANGTTYGQDVTDPNRSKQAEQIIADKESAAIFGEQGWPAQAVKIVGRPLHQQDFASRLMAAQQPTPEGRHAMRTYSQELMQIKNDKDVMAKLAPDLNLHPELREGADANYVALWDARQAATTDAAKAETQGQIDAWLAVQLGANKHGLAQQAIERSTLRWAKGQFTTHADEMTRTLQAMIPADAPPEEVRAQEDMIRVLASEAWPSWGVLAVRLRDAAEWNTDASANTGLNRILLGPNAGMPQSSRSGIERMRALALTEQMLKNVAKVVDDRTDNTLTKSGYTPEQSIAAGIAAAKAKTLLESVGADVFLRRLEMIEPVYATDAAAAEKASAPTEVAATPTARQGWEDPMNAIRGLPKPVTVPTKQPAPVQISPAPVPAARPGWDSTWPPQAIDPAAVQFMRQQQAAQGQYADAGEGAKTLPNDISAEDYNRLLSAGLKERIFEIQQSKATEAEKVKLIMELVMATTVQLPKSHKKYPHSAIQTSAG